MKTQIIALLLPLAATALAFACDVESEDGFDAEALSADEDLEDLEDLEAEAEEPDDGHACTPLPSLMAVDQDDFEVVSPTEVEFDPALDLDLVTGDGGVQEARVGRTGASISCRCDAGCSGQCQMLVGTGTASCSGTCDSGLNDDGEPCGGSCTFRYNFPKPTTFMPMFP